MSLVLKLITAWVVLSVPIALVVGRVLSLGRRRSEAVAPAGLSTASLRAVAARARSAS